MIKKLLFILSFISVSGIATAQNLQLHYDPRNTLYGDQASPRNYVTMTFEMFKMDSYGSTFMFFDMDLNQKHGHPGLAYMEIARDQNLGNLPIRAHIEFNGGLGQSDATYGFPIENAYLAGASYATRIGSFNLSTHLSYRLNTFDKISHDLQWTGVWGTDLLNGKLTVSGFIDIWSENKIRTEAGFKSGKKAILLTEPQFWYNINSHLALGTEIEISKNFYAFYKDQLYVIPTLAAKWNF